MGLLLALGDLNSKSFLFFPFRLAQRRDGRGFSRTYENYRPKEERKKEEMAWDTKEEGERSERHRKDMRRNHCGKVTVTIQIFFQSLIKVNLSSPFSHLSTSPTSLVDCIFVVPFLQLPSHPRDNFLYIVVCCLLLVDCC